MEGTEATAAERLAEHMLKVGPDKWVSLSVVRDTVGIDIDLDRFALSGARDLLRTKHEGRTIERRNNQLRLTRNAEESREYELRNMHNRVERELDRTREHLQQESQHASDGESRQRFADSLKHVGAVASVLQRSKEQAARKQLIRRGGNE